MGTLLGAVLLGGLVAVWPMALAGRVLAGYWRDIVQLLAVAGGALVAGGIMPDSPTRYELIAAGASVGAAFLLHAIYEWVVASADAAKTIVISRHTGRRLPPL